jgi:hypothetical protein
MIALLALLLATSVQVSVNFGQHRLAVTSRDHYCAISICLLVTRAESLESISGKKVRYHYTRICVLVRRSLLRFGTHSSQQ